MERIIRAKDYIYRYDSEKEIQIRLFEDRKTKDGSIMHINLDLEQMKSLRDFLDRKIEAIEAK